MDWYSFISIHKPASRAMLSECLMILDHLSREVEQWTFETTSQQGFDCDFRTSKISSLKTCEWYRMLSYSRNIEAVWNSLFDDKSIWYRCIQDLEIKFTSAINIKWTYLTIQLPIWMPESSLIMSILGYFLPWCRQCLYFLIF